MDECGRKLTRMIGMVRVSYYFVYPLALSDIPGKATEFNFSSLYFWGNLEWFNFLAGGMFRIIYNPWKKES